MVMTKRMAPAYDDVAPVRGVVIGPSGTQTLAVSVDVVSENRQ